MEIVRQRERKTVVEYYREYCFKRDSGSGFSFPCDAEGKLVTMNPDALVNYQWCLDNLDKVDDCGIVERKHPWYEPAIGKCDCGTLVELSGWTNTCDNCGLEYNSSGQVLAPRSQWGEEIGENF
jgi:hypothetical protein